MRILVTGATGFIGSAFCRLALSMSHEVGGMILPTEAIPANFPTGRGMTWLRGTLAEPPWPAIASFKPEACVHFAWIATPGIYLESPENHHYFEWSLSFIRRVCQLSCTYVLGVGTCIEYRIGNQPLSEERTLVEPTTTYARCKNALRLALEAEAKSEHYELAWARVFYPYGVGEHPARLCSSTIQKLRRDERITLKTPESTKDYIYIEDLAAAFMTLIEHRHEGAINLGTGVGHTVLEVAQTLANFMRKPNLVAAADTPALDPLGFVVADASKLRALGWSPAYDLSRGLQKMLGAPEK